METARNLLYKVIKKFEDNEIDLPISSMRKLLSTDDFVCEVILSETDKKILNRLANYLPVSYLELNVIMRDYGKLDEDNVGLILEHAEALSQVPADRQERLIEILNKRGHVNQAVIETTIGALNDDRYQNTDRAMETANEMLAMTSKEGALLVYQLSLMLDQDIEEFAQYLGLLKNPIFLSDKETLVRIISDGKVLEKQDHLYWLERVSRSQNGIMLEKLGDYAQMGLENSEFSDRMRLLLQANRPIGRL